MNRYAILSGLIVCLGIGELRAQSFPFYSVMRAGRQNSGDWNVGAGNPSNGQLSTGFFAYDSTPPLHWNDSGSQQFVMGWDGVNNRGYTTVFGQNGSTTVTIQNTGPALTASTVWTLPANGFFASASPNGGGNSPSSILLQGLTLNDATELSGSLPTSIGAAQSGTATLTSLSAPILLQSTVAGGSWYISGTVQFTGLLSQGGQARGSQLQFFMNAVGTESNTPEPASMALFGSGLVLMAIAHRSHRIRKKE